MDKHTVVHPYKRRLLSNKKEYYWYMRQHGWILKALCWMKYARHRRPHIIWFSLWASRIGKCVVRGSRPLVSVTGQERQGLTTEGQEGTFSGNSNILCNN